MSYIPRAIHAGAEIRPNVMIARIEHDAAGRVTGVLHFRNGSGDGYRGSELFRQREKDQRLIGHSIGKMREILRAANGEDVWDVNRTAHLMGTCRMSRDPRASVVDGDGRAHHIPNLFICDGSVFPTSGAVNSSLTIQAIAARTADRIQVWRPVVAFDRTVNRLRPAPLGGPT